MSVVCSQSLPVGFCLKILTLSSKQLNYWRQVHPLVVSKVSVRKQNRGQQCPKIEYQTSPARADFDPNSGPVACQSCEVRVLWTKKKKKQQQINCWPIFSTHRWKTNIHTYITYIKFNSMLVFISEHICFKYHLLTKSEVNTSRLRSEISL